MAILSRKQNITISVYKAKEAAMSILVFGEQSVQWSFSESTVAESHVKIFYRIRINIYEMQFLDSLFTSQGAFLYNNPMKDIDILLPNEHINEY